MVRVTSARPSGGREAVPAKTTSSILPPRRLLTPCSPMTQENASTMFDLPDPFGPTTHVMPGSNRRVVADAKDLNPRRVRVFRYTCELSSSSGRRPPGTPSRERAVVRSLRTLPPPRALLVAPSPLRRDELPADAAPRSGRAPRRGRGERTIGTTGTYPHDHAAARRAGPSVIMTLLHTWLHQPVITFRSGRRGRIWCGGGGDRGNTEG